MITNKNPFNWDYTDHRACKNCARTANVRTIYVKSGSHAYELCFCTDCWHEIMDNVWPFGEGRESRRK